MDPVSALFLATVIAAVVMGKWGDVITGTARGAAGHGRAQVASEARRAKQAVIDSTKASWRKRLADGEAKGPKSAIWWGLAAVRSARKVHRALRRAGDRSVSLPSAGPFRRVFDAAKAGGAAGYRKARDEARTRRAAGPSLRERARQAARNATAWRRPSRSADGEPTVTGVCDRCGVTCAVAALQREGALLLCALCRAPAVPDDTGTPESSPAGAVEGDEAVHGELVPEPAMAGLTQGELMARTDQELLARAHPADLRELAKRELDRGHLEASRAYLDHAKQVEQAIRENQPVGRVLSRRTVQAAAHTTPQAVARTGDITTHGEGMRFSEHMIEALNRMAQCKEAMLGGLTSVSAHEDQVRAIRVWADHERAVQAHWRNMIETVDPRVRKFIDALDGEGRKVAGVIDHYSEV